jgi:hypothetical protein
MAHLFRAGHLAGSKPVPHENYNVQRIIDKSSKEPDNADQIDWQILKGARQPGPADYDLPDGKKERESMGSISLSCAKTPGFIDVCMLHANDTPAPHDYDTLKGRGISDSLVGGRMGKTKPKGMLDELIYWAKDRPGPGYYEVDQGRKINGLGGSSMVNDPRNMSIVLEEKRSRSIPGPEYDLDRTANYHKRDTGTKFSRYADGKIKKDPSKPEKLEKSMLDWVMHRAKQTPGPGGTYDISKALDAVECKSKGTRMGKTNIGKRYVELLVEPKARQGPGPGAYETTRCLEKLGVTCVKDGGGFTMSGRPSLGQLPGRFASMSSAAFSSQYGEPSGIDIRLNASADHPKVLTPWRDNPTNASLVSESGSWSNLAKQAPARMLSRDEKLEREAGSFTDAVLYKPRRMCRAPRCKNTFLTGSAFTNSINSTRRKEAKAAADLNLLKLGETGTYADCEQVQRYHLLTLLPLSFSTRC